jgi:pimeloyl-ACP methyl ester carboxylesterase
LAKFISALKLENPILIGHSLGGVIATEYALRNQDKVRGLLLEDTGPPRGLPLSTLSEPFLLPLEFGSKMLMRNALRLAGLPRRGALAKALIEDALSASPGQYLAFSKAVSRWNVESVLPSLDIPILLVWGGKDRIMPLKIGRQYLHILSQAEMLIVPDAGHSPHLERPNAFAGALHQFIDRCVSESDSIISEISSRSLIDRISRWIRISIFGS